jgi:pyrroline-5-carboxylate reductase|tara:strand:+ start:436 stop:1281 length:846 start_codon:yes stop_codon:yes gene_type:complete
MLKKIGVIGCGNMASAVVEGIYSKNQNIEFLTYTPSYTRAEALASKVKGTAVKEIKALAEADTLLIGCKPQQFLEVAKLLRESFELKDKYILSILAATSVEIHQQELGCTKVTRIMPSLPIEFNEGISLIYHSPEVEVSLKEKVNSLLTSASKVYEMKTQEEFNKVTVVSASGPAYIYYITSLFAKALEKWNIDGQTAREMSVQLLRGSTTVMEQKTKDSLDELVDKVTSKKGVTIEAVNTLKDQQIDKILFQALDNAYLRSQEIEADFSKLAWVENLVEE